MALRILSCALFVNPRIISLVKLLHAIEVPLCVISVFKYSVANFDKRLSSTIFLIGFKLPVRLGLCCFQRRLGYSLTTQATKQFSSQFRVLSV